VIRPVSAQLAEFPRLAPTPQALIKLVVRLLTERLWIKPFSESIPQGSRQHSAVACPDLSIRERPENQ